MNDLNALLLAFIAGFATNIGILFTYLGHKKVGEIIVVSLSFAFGVMTLISIKELIPQPLNYIFHTLNFGAVIIILFLCPLLALLIVKLSKAKIKEGSSLYKVGVLNMLSLLIHNIPEGIVVFTSSIASPTLGLKIALSIMAHNLPEGICIAVPIYYSTNNRKKALLYTFISGIAEPIGALLTYLFLKPFISLIFLSIILYFVGCLMLIIAITEILPEILSYHKKICFCLGILCSLLILLI